MNWEFDWLYALQQIHNPVLDKIMVALSTIGNAGILWIVLAARRRKKQPPTTP